MKKHSSFVTGLYEAFEVVADKTIAAGAKAYMRNQFEFIGLKSADRRKIFKQYLKENFPEQNEFEQLIWEMWQLTERDFQYCAIDLFLATKKYWQPETIDLIEKIAIHKSWWDTIDFIASYLAGNYFLLFPENKIKITNRWNKSDNFWLQRISILFQLKYKTKTDTALLTKYILNCANEKEFFLRKAIGWALREYSKTDEAFVLHFVEEHTLSFLSKKEALKVIERKR